MRIAYVSEGETEFACLPKIAGRLGHTVVSNVHVGGCHNDWGQTFAMLILPYVQTAALKNPDKILIVVDREDRADCCPELVRQATAVISEGLRGANLEADFAIVVCDRTFEAVLMSDYELVDRMDILARPVSPEFGVSLDGKSPKACIARALKPGKKYHKVRHGAALASKIRLLDDDVLSRSRSLRKLVKELR